jgi:triacylglycerol lipase
VSAITILVLGLAAVAALVAGLVGLVRRRRRWLRRMRRARRRASPRLPVLLLHGLFGFDEVAVGPVREKYFRGLTQRLDRLDARVHRARVAPTASVGRRAEQLVRTIETLSAKRVNLVAHSLGGLDARYALARLGLADRVASLVTIATPHRGTPLADLGARLGGRLGVRRILTATGWDVGAFDDLTTAQARVFNRRVRDVRGVWYGSVVGFAKGRSLNPLLWPTYAYLSRREGPNDGIVSVASQRWGEVVAEIEADHWAQIGWSWRFDPAELFEELLRELRGLGF